jgi:hypothetical protein
MFAPGAPAQQPTALQSPGYGRPGPSGGPQGSPAMLQPTLVPPPSSMGPQLAPQQLQPQPQVPMMRIPASQPPPYRAQSASRGTRPIEPWRDNLRMMMFLWGVALLVAFATPLTTSPELTFNWQVVMNAQGTAKLPLLIVAAVGLLSVLIAAIPMPSSARGLLATLLGLGGVAVPIALVGVPPWRPLASLAGMLLLVPALVLRGEYRSSLLPRLMVTLGAAGILAPFLVPDGGTIPLVNVIKGLIELPGTQKVVPALTLGLIVVVVMSLLAWLPAPVTGGAHIWAWLLILWSLVVHATDLVLRGNIADAITKAPNSTLVSWIAGGASGVAIGSAYLVLVGYGLASVVGKQLE